MHYLTCLIHMELTTKLNYIGKLWIKIEIIMEMYNRKNIN